VVGATGSISAPGGAHRIDYGGVANLLRALEGREPRIALMISIYVARREDPTGSVGQLLQEAPLRAPRRAYGAPYTIVRPSWFDQVEPGDDRLVFEQGDRSDGGIGREQVAEVLVRSLITDAAVGRTFELFAAPGDPPTDWDDLFGLPTRSRASRRHERRRGPRRALACLSAHRG
jgi:uncharacterized protein YbjT (DUF2867 family)